MKKILAFLMTFILLLSFCMFGASAKVYALTMGIHKYSINNHVTDGSDVATLTYVRHKDGSEGSQNKIYDLEFGETLTLTTAVKEGQEEYYTFLGWLDQDGAFIGYDETITITIDGSKTAIAAYAERADRFVVSFPIVKGEGSASATSNRPIYTGDECISALQGSNVTIKFAPAKGYKVQSLKLNDREISMMSHVFSTMDNCVKSLDIKGYFNAILNGIKFLIGKDATYTIYGIHGDMEFEIAFAKKLF